MNSTPSTLARIIRFTALHPPPPTPMTLIFAPSRRSSLNDSLIPDSFGVILPPIARQWPLFSLTGRQTCFSILPPMYRGAAPPSGERALRTAAALQPSRTRAGKVLRAYLQARAARRSEPAARTCVPPIQAAGSLRDRKSTRL